MNVVLAAGKGDAEQQEELPSQFRKSMIALDAGPRADGHLPEARRASRRSPTLTNNIAASAGDIPQECGLGDRSSSRGAGRRKTYTWKASGLCHKPLYFEDEQLERYGHACCGPLLQPLVSAGKFFLTLPVLPYEMGLYPPNECIYTLGVYRARRLLAVHVRRDSAERAGERVRGRSVDRRHRRLAAVRAAKKHRAVHVPFSAPKALYFSHSPRPQPLPQQFGAPQDSRTGQADALRPLVWAAGTLRFFVNCDAPHDGQTGFSWPRIKHLELVAAGSAGIFVNGHRNDLFLNRPLEQTDEPVYST